MASHLENGEFKSDKYPETPRGLVPLKPTDPMAQDLLWEYAQRRCMVDKEFSADLKVALQLAGYKTRTCHVHDREGVWVEKDQLCEDCYDEIISEDMDTSLALGREQMLNLVVNHVNKKAADLFVAKRDEEAMRFRNLADELRKFIPQR